MVAHLGARPDAPPSRPEADRGHGPLALAILLGSAVRLALAAVVPLGHDEAYYVDWARHLEPGYLDHPPAVAWLAAGPLRFLGASPFAVRLPEVILGALTLVLATSLVDARAGRRAALATAVALQAAPLFSLGTALLTPDAPLALAWVGTFWALERALDRGPPWALAAGAFLGVGALSKLTAGLLGVAVFSGLLATRDGRRLLATPFPWAGAALALAIASPMLLWNAAHGWPSFAFQATHGLSGHSFRASRLLASLGGQLGYVSPLLLVLAAAQAFRALFARRDALNAALAFSALPLAAFFTLAAAFTPNALPHWPGPGWLSAILLLCLSGAAGRPFRRALWVGYAEIGIGLSALLFFLAVPVPARVEAFGRSIPVARGPLDDLVGWREGARAARAVAGRARLAAAHWIVLGQLGVYDQRSPAYLGERITGPSFYDPDPGAAGEPLLLVTVDGLGPQAAELEKRLGPLEPAGSAEARQGDRLVRIYRFFWWRPRRTP